LDTKASKEPSGERWCYATGVGSGAVFDAGGSWLETRRRNRRGKEDSSHNHSWAAPVGMGAFGSRPDQPRSPSVVEGLVIPPTLDSVSATNFVLTQQPGKLKPKDLRKAIREARAERQLQAEEQEALRALTADVEAAAAPDDDRADANKAGVAGGEAPSPADADMGVLQGGCGEGIGALGNKKSALGLPRRRQPAELSGRVIRALERGAVAMRTTRQLKEMSFLQEVQEVEEKEKERSFKASVEHIGEPLLSLQEIWETLAVRRGCQAEAAAESREEERGATLTLLRGPKETGLGYARPALLLTGTGFQGVGFEHVPDWDLFKGNDWGRQRGVLSRLVSLVSRWITQQRAGRRLGCIKAKLSGLSTREQVAAMVVQDNTQVTKGYFVKTTSSQLAVAAAAGGGGGLSRPEEGWEFPNPVVVSEALASEMLGELLGGPGGVRGSGSRGGEVPPPPEFNISGKDIHRYSFYLFADEASAAREPEYVNHLGPPMDFVDLDLFRLKETDEDDATGYQEAHPLHGALYLPLERSRPLRTGAYEECGVRQPRDHEQVPIPPSKAEAQAQAQAQAQAEGGWREAISTSERRGSKATFGRRRSSVGLRSAVTPSETASPEEKNLLEADRRLTELAKDAEVSAVAPDTILHPPPPPGGVDLITPDPRHKPFVPDLGRDEADPAWCLQPSVIPREVPVTKGLLQGYSPGSTTLRAHAGAPTISSLWRPARERRSSGLSCMRGQASAGVWSPSGVTPRGIGKRTAPTRGGGGGGLMAAVAASGGAGPRGKARAGVGAGAGGGEEGCTVVYGEDRLSDSESEDEGEEVAVPTVLLARGLFLEGGGHVAGEKDGGGGVDVVGEGGNSCGVGGGTGRVDRDKAILEMERGRRAERDRSMELLSGRLSAVATQVRNVRHAFVLQKPYHRI
ncbi:unnamed protein product, partial [Discosporangium mesarthrocarpum]